jgi:hypothetical protein
VSDGTHAQITLVPGSVAPRYPDGEAIGVVEVVITEQGMQSGLPLVDFVCRDRHGHQFVLTLTGRIVLGIGGALRGVNLRNHGKAEP